MQNNDALITPFFKTISVLDEVKSKEANRPIYRDEEFVEVRIAGDRNFAPTFPAHQMWKREDGEEITYAQRWQKQYAAFKEDRIQVAEGTPLEELTFLTQAKRHELRALKIYTAEALAALEGRNLKALGMEGQKLKAQAQAFLDTARGTGDNSRMAAEIAELRAKLARFEGAALPPEDAPVASEFSDWSDEDLKSWIKEATGSAPRGNPSHDSLVRLAEEVQSEAA